MSNGLRIGIAVCVIVFAIIGLMYRGVQIASQEVVMVSDILGNPSYYAKARSGMRLGARVSDKVIEYRNEPSIGFKFSVHDPLDISRDILVDYSGVKPNTFAIGRDVLLEGSFDGNVFHATVLLTQCPSKYRASSDESPL